MTVEVKIDTKEWSALAMVSVAGLAHIESSVCLQDLESGLKNGTFTQLDVDIANIMYLRKIAMGTMG
ncbi:MAG: hypothetical protein ACE5ES_00655 [Candidatus Nanoarchaeia archaeon]